GTGVPPAAASQPTWPYMQPLLADPALRPGHSDLLTAEDQSEMLLSIRATSPLLPLGPARLVHQKLSFPHSGPDATPGVILERIADAVGPNVHPRLKGLVI